MIVAILAHVLAQDPTPEALTQVVIQRSERLELFDVERERAKRISASILEASIRFGIKPARILAVIEAESAYGVTPVSRAACVGLMQLNPNTAPSVAKSIGMKWYNLGRVEHNIMLGSAYLKQLFDRYGSWPKALTAYNMGPGRFKRNGSKISQYAKSIEAKTKLLESIL